MNPKRALAVATVVALQLVMIAPVVVGDPVSPLEVAERYVPRTAGVEKEMSFFFGPFVIPPGQDNNRVTVDVPLHGGFFTAIAPNLVDATTGHSPSDLEMHIHHAHWFRVSDDPSDEYYALNLAWIFGTGEEKTQGSLHDRADAEPGGPRYGIYVPQGQPQSLIFMLHNKIAQPKTMYITLDVTFVYGTAAEIEAAPGCPLLQAGETCRAGETFHEVKGRLWGSTFDVPREPDGDGTYIHPIDIPAGHPTRRATDALGRYYVAPFSGTVIASAGHLHPNGRAVVVANLGPEGSGCEADVDGDGFPGTTLYYSRKINRVPEAGSHSEEYQMGATKAGFRAPVHQGDRITQFGVYDNKDHASYEAMSYVGIYIDRQQPPAPAAPGCLSSDYAPILVDDPSGDARETVMNHAWHHDPLPYCGILDYAPCDLPVPDLPPGEATSTIHIAGFAYLPGDQALSGQLGAPPRIAQGETITVVNEDVALGIRHTVTSCPWPCNGPYVANYPQPDGLFDTGKLGNLDYIDGGVTGDDTSPVYELETESLEPGLYAYYCRIHPTMRGWFEITPA